MKTVELWVLQLLWSPWLWFWWCCLFLSDRSEIAAFWVRLRKQLKTTEADVPQRDSRKSWSPTKIWIGVSYRDRTCWHSRKVAEDGVSQHLCDLAVHSRGSHPKVLELFIVDTETLLGADWTSAHFCSYLPNGGENSALNAGWQKLQLL